MLLRLAVLVLVGCGGIHLCLITKWSILAMLIVSGARILGRICDAKYRQTRESKPVHHHQLHWSSFSMDTNWINIFISRFLTETITISGQFGCLWSHQSNGYSVSSVVCVVTSKKFLSFLKAANKHMTWVSVTSTSRSKKCNSIFARQPREAFRILFHCSQNREFLFPYSGH